MVIRRLLRSEEGFALKFVISTLILVIIIIAVMVEFGPILWFKITTIEDAEEIAFSVAKDYRMYEDADKILELAAYKLGLMGYEDDEIRECVVELLPAESSQKTSVRVTVVKYANSFIISRIKQLKKISRVATTKEAPIPTKIPGSD